MTSNFDIEELESIMFDGQATLDCGCIVEPDGTCPCGNQSPLLELGMIQVITKCRYGGTQIILYFIK